mmetsp:Transcript_16083/g.23508  ORF Transcript_16083/g.23508 Transcript_16083/m.23508 type:complete len:343 (-) Transcript_16083:193-1221(-)
MAPSLFELINVNSKDEVDEGAVIQAAQQNPEDLDQIFEFDVSRYLVETQVCPLHKAIELELSTDVIASLISTFAIRQKVNLGWTVLHWICRTGNPSYETLSVVLDAWPDAARENAGSAGTPLHLICINESASLEMLSAVLNAWTEAAREKDRYGWTPLHNICINESASLETLSVVLNAWPEAAREKDEDSWNPLHLICTNESASLKMVQTIADALVEGKGNRTSHSVISLISAVEYYLEKDADDVYDEVIRDDIKKLLHHLSSLYKEDNQSNPSPREIMTHFINTSWWNGVWLVVNRHPSIAKTMKLQTTLMTDFLFTAGKRLSLASMMEVIKNEPDLLEGV